MPDLREQILRAGTDAEAWRAALFLVFAAPVNDADPVLVKRIREVESLVRQRDGLRDSVVRSILDNGLRQVDVAREAQLDRFWINKLVKGVKIPQVRLVEIGEAVCRILAARGERG